MIIAIDFDGTLCEHKFPDIGTANTKLINKLIYLSEYNELILWTCREGEKLDEAIKWCEKLGLKFDAINENVDALKNKDFALRKIYADIYLDDRNCLIDEFIENFVII